MLDLNIKNHGNGNDIIDITKATQILMANTTLRRYIEITLVLELDLLNNPRPVDQILSVQIIINFEPSRVQDLFSLFDPSAVIDSNPLQGMIQICAVISEKEVQFDTFWIEDVEKLLEEEVLLRKEPTQMGIIQWVRDAGEFLDIANTVGIIHDESIELEASDEQRRVTLLS